MVNVVAQKQSKHEFSVWAAGGLSTIKSNIDAVDCKNGVGGSLGIGYNHSLTNQWSIGTGLELTLYNTKVTFDNYSDSYNSNDGQYDFEFQTAITDYEENQNTIFLNIPVMIQFQMPVFADNQFYIAGGFKFGIPVTKKYKITNAAMKNSGFYPIWSGEENLILDSQEFMGFGNFNRKDIEEDFELKVAYIISMEGGIKCRLNETLSVYTGAYFDYGLNDINKENNKNLVQYNVADPPNFINNSILQTRLTNKVVPMAVGLKIRLAFGL
jgi:hypothetical protein